MNVTEEKKSSARGELNKDDIKSWAKGAGIAGVGAVGTFVLQEVGNLDLGEYQPIAVAGISIIFNFFRKLICGKRK